MTHQSAADTAWIEMSFLTGSRLGWSPSARRTAASMLNRLFQGRLLLLLQRIQEWQSTSAITVSILVTLRKCRRLRGWGFAGYAERMGQSVSEMPADTLVSAVDNAHRGVVTHLTIKGEQVAAIVSESTLAMSHLLAALLASEMAASALPAVLPAAFPWASSLPDDHLKAFAGELREAVVAESPELVERVLLDWQAVAEVRAGTRST